MTQQFRRTGNAHSDAPETLDQLYSRLAREAEVAYSASPYSALSKDFFSRFSRDPDAVPAEGEVEIDSSWAIEIPRQAEPLTRLMAGHLADFLLERMGVNVPVVEAGNGTPGGRHALALLEHGGGDPGVPESFTVGANTNRIMVHGRDPCALRDGVVRLVNEMGLRQAPFVEMRQRVFRPRLSVRLGREPWLGSYRDLVFMGYNAALLPGGGAYWGANLFAVSTSDAIPELRERRKPDALAGMCEAAHRATEYGLGKYCKLSTVEKFPKDHPVFVRHPEIRGPLTFKADGEYILCTEHPLVRQYLTESVEGVFRAIPGLDGALIIVGGEDFYHCFMHPFGAPTGHTTCPRCEPLGPATVVANLCNTLAEAARRANPNAQIIAWPYSAEHVWAPGDTLSRFIRGLRPGAAVLTEIEKDEYLQKPDGVRKHVWDYSIDLIGPGDRAKRQISQCKAQGVTIYLKSEPELAFEAPRLPHVPCLDRWLDRAEALASSGVAGAWASPYFRPYYGSTAAEANQWMWWDPAPDKGEILRRLAERIAGKTAGPSLTKAWQLVSEAIGYSPELPSYYTGPYYLGPAHPMCADPKAELPEVFHGQYLFHAEVTEENGLTKEPTFVRSPSGDVPVFHRFYRKMTELLGCAVSEVEKTGSSVPQRCLLAYEAEASPIRWFYHTARTQANFYESCQLRDRVVAAATKTARTLQESDEALDLCRRWRDVLLDEQENARQALPVAEADMRLDFYYGGDHTFPHTADMLRAKLELIRRELDEFLPSLERRIGQGI